MNFGKKAVLKFYGQDRHDHEFCYNKLHELEVKYKNIIKYFKYYFDYHPKVGVHFNIHIISSNYNMLRLRYTKPNEKKDPLCFLWMKDIEDHDEYHQWVRYCNDRENHNWKIYKPVNMILDDPDDGGSSEDSPQNITPSITF